MLKVRKQFAYNTARMRARYQLLHDLTDGKTIHVSMQTLHICDLQCIKYELRSSILPSAHPMHAYALYRIEHDKRAEAIVEGITNWHLAIDNNMLLITIFFLDQQKLEITHWLPL